jgi:hypothetical protein
MEAAADDRREVEQGLGVNLGEQAPVRRRLSLAGTTARRPDDPVVGCIQPTSAIRSPRPGGRGGAERQMFDHRYLTVRVTPGEKGRLELYAEPAKDCQACSATCRGKNSLGGFLVDPEDERELVLDLEVLRRLVGEHK